MRLDYLCMVTLVLSTAIGGSARKRGGKRNKFSKPSWRSSSSPVLLEPSPGQVVEAGQPYSFNCGAKGKPKPKVSWTHNGLPIPNSDLFELSKKNSILKINEANTATNGTFTCTAENDIGSISHTFNLQIKGDPWPFNMTLKDNVTATVGAMVSFKCRVEGPAAPTVSFTWSSPADSQDQTFPSQWQTRQLSEGESQLYIMGVREEHQGQYTCKAENNRGFDTKTVWLTVNPQPTQPAYVYTDRFNPDNFPTYFPRNNDNSGLEDEFSTITTKSPRHRNRGDKSERRRNRNRNRNKNKKNKNRKNKNREDQENRDNLLDFPVTSPGSSATDYVTPDLETRPTVWVFNKNRGSEAADDRIRQPPTVVSLDNTSTAAPVQHANMEISSWAIYTGVGAVGGLVLLIGLLAVTLTLCCKREDEAVYKSTPV